MPSVLKKISGKAGQSLGTVPATNNIGVAYPRWHAKHPKNAIAVPASVAPTKTLSR